jgi:signal transduction histidine kinase
MRLVVPIIIGLLGILTPVSAMAQSLPRTILLIDEDTPIHPWFRHLIEALDSTVKTESDHVFVYVENLGIIAGFGTENYYKDLHSHYLEKYRGHPIGVIVCHALRAMPYVLRLRDELWPGTPVILAGLQETALAPLSLPPNVTGFTFRHHLQDLLDTAHTLIPGLKQIVLVGDRIGPDSWWRYFIEDLPAVQARFGVIDLTGLPIAELRQRLAKLPGDAAVVYISISIDSVTGKRYVGADIVQFVSEVSNRPTFVGAEVFIGTGSVGGLAVSASAIGNAAAQLALRILNGESASNIPIRDGDVVKPIFDWRQLQRWGISESRLPAGSEIRFRSPTAWEQYRWQIILTAVALLGQMLLIVWLLSERHRRQRAEVETRQRSTELAHMNRRAVAGQMSASIAHEVNQPLTAILSNAETLHDLLGQERLDLGKIREIVADIIAEDTRASEVIDRIRKLLRKDESKSEIVDLNELVESTMHLLHGDLVKRKTNVETALAPDLPAIAGDPVQLQQVLLNLLINAIDAVGGKAPPRRMIKISTRTNGKHVEANIADFGHGIAAGNQQRLFEPFFTTKGHGLGLGLSICSTIVKAHGGQLGIDNNDYGGATVVLSFPSAQAALRQAS